MAAEQANYVCLIDPDSTDVRESVDLAVKCEKYGADIILVGGSIMLHNRFRDTLRAIKNAVSIPVLIFPGVFEFVSPDADALLLLSVVSSRNAQMLIGDQVRSAPLIKSTGVEAIGTAYMLIESGSLSSVQYMSYSIPIPREKHDIAVAHALAAQYLGFRLLYMDAGSGADYSISPEMIKRVKQNTELPLFIGGGIRTPEDAYSKAEAGADFIVTGTSIENTKDHGLIKAFADAIHKR